MYVVALAEQPGVPRAMDTRPRRYEVTSEPVGLQHATDGGRGVATPQRALCGADVDGWIVFADRRFEPARPASCQRCAQLASTAPRRSSREEAPAGPVLPAWLGRRIRARAVGHVVILGATGCLGDAVDDLDLAAGHALSGGPRAVVCDLTGTTETGEPDVLRRLAQCGRYPRDWPGVPLAVAGLDRRSGEKLADQPLGRHLMVTGSVEQALARSLQVSPPLARSVQLAPHPTAPRASRDFVSRSLLDWGLNRHLPSACLVVSELVTNAMIHAGSTIDLSVSGHQRAVRIAVGDRSAQRPDRGAADAQDVHGRGLTIVTGLSGAWGVLPRGDGGKVVWAVVDGSPRVVGATV